MLIYLHFLENVWMIVEVLQSERNEPRSGSIGCKEEAHHIIINDLLRQGILVVHDFDQRVQNILGPLFVPVHLSRSHNLMYLFQEPVPSLQSTSHAHSNLFGSPT